MSSALDADMPLRAVLTALSKSGLNAGLRTEDESGWCDVLGRLRYAPVDYSPAMIDYQLAYCSGKGLPVVDISLVLLHDNRQCAIWPLSLTSSPEGQWQIGSNGGMLLPPLFVAGLARKSIKSVSAECLKFIEQICALIAQSGIDTVEPYASGDGLSEWHDRMMQSGARVDMRHDLFLDLLPSMVEIKRTFRKSYKALITSGGKLWKVGLASSADPALWDEFRLLHLAVAGRATRSLESWRLQHDAIASGDAFLVYLRDSDGRMVGGGLFHTTPHEGLYAIGAYDRSLFDKPLGHVVQYHAIEEMKRRGVRWYKLGVRCYSSEKPEPSEKEVAISNFKQGFSSHIFPRYLVHHHLKNPGK